MVEIVLVRHGSTAWSGRRYCGKSDPPLSAAGRAEVTALAERLASSLAGDSRLISSPSRRAMATAEAIAAACGGLQIERDERWQEIDFGLAEGRTFEDLETIAPAIAAALAAGTANIDWPGGETSSSLEARVAEAWTELVAVGRRSIVVTHAGPIIHALALARQRRPNLSDLLGAAMIARVTVANRRTPGSPVLPSGS